MIMIEKENITTRELSPDEILPYDLLLLADESMVAIDKYVHQCLIYVMEHGSIVVGVYALYSITSEVGEIKNIAVAKKFQQQGLGTQMLQDAMRRARDLGFHDIIVGTPVVATKQIRFYKKCGFQKYRIKELFLSIIIPHLYMKTVSY